MSDAKRPPARPAFRLLAALVAVVCFGLTGLSPMMLGQDWRVGAGIFLFVGLMMTAIATAGYWPRRRT
jgi:hypothetical protein